MCSDTHEELRLRYLEAIAAWQEAPESERKTAWGNSRACANAATAIAAHLTKFGEMPPRTARRQILHNKEYLQ